jgi:predicted Fe-Mo cluster-binding NifX family protein
MNHKIAVAVEENIGMEPRVAEHFGHCSKFNVYEINDNKEIVKEESYNNPLSGHQGGACQLPAYVQQFGVNTIIAGGMGAKAVMLFQSFGIEVITAPGLNIIEAIKKLLNGNLSGYTECTSHGHDHNCE